MRTLLRRAELIRAPALRRSYDVVIIGAGGHGLATAFYLAAAHRIRNVAVIERSYIGAGATGRNTTIIRSNYITPAAIPFYRRSAQLYRELSRQVQFNILRSERGVLDVVHSHPSLATERRRVEINQAFGVHTVLVSPAEIKRLCPPIDLAAGGRPIIGGSYHRQGAIARHDAVAWGYAAAAGRLGVEVHQYTEVEGLVVNRGRCAGVRTNRGTIRAGAVVSAVAANTTAFADHAGFKLPIATHPLQAFVTEPYKRVLDVIIGSNDLLVYVSQTARGELLVGAELDPYPSYCTRSTPEFLAYASARCIELLPFMARTRILRQWTGLCDVTPDYSPIIDESPLPGLYISAGWGTWGFKAIPAGGEGMASLIATGHHPNLIAPFQLSRFRNDACVAERASAGTH